MNGIKTGNIVKFRTVADAGDENARSLVPDDYGTDSAKGYVHHSLCSSGGFLRSEKQKIISI